MKENLFDPCKALLMVLTQGILDWKMPIFRGFLYAFLPACTAIYSGLQDYRDLGELDGLSWLKLTLAASIASGTALAGYLDSSFTRTKDRLQERADQPGNPFPIQPSPP